MRDLLPQFRLPSSRGREIGPADFKPRRNLVLFFFRGEQCEACLDTLDLFAADYEAYRDRETEILAIDTESLDRVAALAHERHLPFPVLADPRGDIFRRFVQPVDGATPPAVAVFIADRFGEVFATYVATRGEDAPTQEEILSWLGLIEVQCPECGAPEWRL